MMKNKIERDVEKINATTKQNVYLLAFFYPPAACGRPF
jgi:hypothetical protein